jgi:hypothetical protein
MARRQAAYGNRSATSPVTRFQCSASVERRARSHRRSTWVGDAWQNVSSRARRLALGQLPGERQGEAESILDIGDLCLAHQPLPVEIRIPEQDPREPFRDTRIEVGTEERPEQYLGGICALA